MGKICLFAACFFYALTLHAQIPVDSKQFSKASGVSLKTGNDALTVQWPAGAEESGRIVISLNKQTPLFSSLQLISKNHVHEIMQHADPAFLLTVGRRDLVSQNGWNIFFDKVPLKPHQTFPVQFTKKQVAVSTERSRTIIRFAELTAGDFSGELEITLYNGSPLINIAAVMSTEADSTAIIYDAGIISHKKTLNNIGWADVHGKLKNAPVHMEDTSTIQAVKYRTIIGTNDAGSMAIFPAPHQYFYPLDEAFNLRFTWYGSGYNKMLEGYGLGIRQDLNGDRRYVPWFNAPPKTKQRLNFFCYLSAARPAATLEKVKAFTHADSYLPLPGYKTMVSHFHNEHIMKVVLAGKPVPDTPNFIKVFRAAGVNIVHLAEFHYTAHPKGPDTQRLTELQALFHECKRLSSADLLLLPGEEPNEFFGGHWLEFFPRPVYWIMSRKDGQPFETDEPGYGKVYRIGNATEMLSLLQKENGLAWTAHARTKGSTGFPDAYKNEPFFLSDHFLGAAWKAMPADLSEPRLGKRVLDLMDDFNNWGVKKKVLSEADLFSIEPENEMYAHLNVNYLQLAALPAYETGWQPVLDALQQGKFFSSTGEVLLPAFSVDGHTTGETVKLAVPAKAMLHFDLQWTFPMNFAEIISGDGRRVYRERIDLTNTISFGKKTINRSINLSGRKWVRLEAWDVAANGAFSQTIWLQ